MIPRRRCSLALLAVIALGAGCAKKAPPPKAAEGELHYTVRSFSDTEPVTGLAIAAHTLFGGTPEGLVAWDIARGTVRRIGHAEGMPGAQVRAVASDLDTGLWIASDEGVSRLLRGTWISPKADVPAAVAAASLMVASPDGSGAWVGGSRGVARVTRDGYQPFLNGAAVTALMLAADGRNVWVGTRGEGVHEFDGKRFRNHTVADGLRMREIGALAATAEGLPIATGAAADATLAAIYDGKRWWTYTLGNTPLRALGQFQGKAWIAVGHSLATLARTGKGDGLVKLKPVGPDAADAPDLWLHDEPGRFPEGATAVLADATEGLFFGTEWLGVLRPDGDAFRTRDLLGDREKLLMGCTSAGADGEPRCYLSGKGDRAYVWNGRALVPVVIDPTPGLRTLGFASDPAGHVVAFTAEAGKQSVLLSRESDGHFEPQYGADVHVPEGAPEVTFASFSPDGALWIGLRWRDGAGEGHDWGVAVVSPDDRVVYHRTHLAPGESRGAGSLALPDDLTDVWFDRAHGVTWLSARSGIVRVKGVDTRVFTENDGLEDEAAFDVEGGDEGTVWVATAGGIEIFDGTRWSAPAQDLLAEFLERSAEEEEEEARTRAHALCRAPSGTLYVGTEHGVLAIDRTKRSLFGEQEGLLGDHVLDVRVDPRMRIWVLTTDGLSVVEVSSR